MTNTEKKTTKQMQVHRVAGRRGQGAGSLYCYGYVELAQVLGVTPMEVAQHVLAGDLDPLSLVELVHARKLGLPWLRGVLASQTKNAQQLRAMRPDAVSDVAVASPPASEPPHGLEAMWALTYSDVAAQLGVAVTTVRSAAKGSARALNIRDLGSVLDYVAAKSPLAFDS